MGSASDAHQSVGSAEDSVLTGFVYKLGVRSSEGEVVVVGPFATRELAEAAAQGQPVLEVRSAASTAPNGHFPECPNAAGACCPWMGECTCQCLCDLIEQVEARVRSEGAAA